ncbi:tandem-95 repeat protein [Novosphingobium sp. ERN07]|uniref:tandem-95 repeat protein n=1 Tax=Novosphingobium sp. ERN07 TaxID=2726187 RepID=UPI0014568BFF|nr:tandem-95 repeat protein [Novosphingobium sp. ERN07]NLR73248.1 tandem-95 repeat protein [Novosphingobium sp. ERN07]
MVAVIAPVGTELLVNTLTGGTQINSSVTALSNGGFVVTWYDRGRQVGATMEDNISAQIYDASGAKVGGEFQVPSAAVGAQANPAITALAGGKFVVTWSDNSGALGEIAYGIKAQIFDATGGRVGAEFRVNTNVQGDQQFSAVTALNNGNFVVTWADRTEFFGSISSTIRAQIYTESGVKVGNEFVANLASGNNMAFPAVASLANGGFVISWTQGNADNSDRDIRAIILNADGSRASLELFMNSVNSTVSFPQDESSVTGLADGGFVITWMDRGGNLRTPAEDADGFSIRAQIYNADGNRRGGDFLVNTDTIRGQQFPAVTALQNGGFAITWEDESNTLGDTSSAGIRVQAFSATGVRIGTEVRVNTQTLNKQVTPSIDTLANGDIVISWADYGPQTDIFAQPDIKAQILSVYTGPRTTNDTAVVNEDRAVTFDVRTNDVTIDTLQVTHIAGTAITAGGAVVTLAEGTVALGLDGRLTFTPSADFNGPATFAYTVVDGQGNSKSATATVTVTPVNDAPVLSGTQAVLPHGTEGTPYTVSTAALLAGFTDIDGDTLSVLLDLSPEVGSVSQSGGIITITPAENFSGTITLNYAVTDRRGALVLASQDIVIDPVTDAPVITSNGGGEVVAISIAENITDVTTVTATDGDGDTPTFAIAGGADAALFTIDETSGVLTFLTAPNFEAPTDQDGDNIYDVVVQASDAGGLFAEQEIAVTVLDLTDGLIITGTDRNDTITPTASNNGLARSTASNDVLIGNGGVDTLDGGEGDDRIDGGAGADKLFGGLGDDTLLGGDAIDQLRGGEGADTMIGGLGADSYWVDNAGDVVIEERVIDAGTGKEVGGIDLVTASVSYTLSANVEKLTLESGAGNINGTGNALANTLLGNEGDNVLNGGAGKDTLRGGLGADAFQFSTLELTANSDTVQDFTAGEDRIELSISAFSALADFGLGALDPGELAFGTRATTADQHLIYNSATGGLFYDADGSGSAAQVRIAVLTGLPTLQADDIVLI